MDSDKIEALAEDLAEAVFHQVDSTGLFLKHEIKERLRRELLAHGLAEPGRPCKPPVELPPDPKQQALIDRWFETEETTESAKRKAAIIDAIHKFFGKPEPVTPPSPPSRRSPIWYNDYRLGDIVALDPAREGGDMTVLRKSRSPSMADICNEALLRLGYLTPKSDPSDTKG